MCLLNLLQFERLVVVVVDLYKQYINCKMSRFLVIKIIIYDLVNTIIIFIKIHAVKSPNEDESKRLLLY